MCKDGLRMDKMFEDIIIIYDSKAIVAKFQPLLLPF